MSSSASLSDVDSSLPLPPAPAADVPPVPAQKTVEQQILESCEAADASTERMARYFGIDQPTASRSGSAANDEGAGENSQQQIDPKVVLLERLQRHERILSLCADSIEELFSQAMSMEARLEKARSLCKLATAKLEDFVAQRAVIQSPALDESTESSSRQKSAQQTTEAALALLSEIEAETRAESERTLSTSPPYKNPSKNDLPGGADLVRTSAQMLALTLTLDELVGTKDESTMAPIRTRPSVELDGRARGRASTSLGKLERSSRSQRNSVEVATPSQPVHVLPTSSTEALTPGGKFVAVVKPFIVSCAKPIQPLLSPSTYYPVFGKHPPTVPASDPSSSTSPSTSLPVSATDPPQPNQRAPLPSMATADGQPPQQCCIS